jgi:hypothetical protein
MRQFRFFINLPLLLNLYCENPAKFKFFAFKPPFRLKYIPMKKFLQIVSLLVITVLVSFTAEAQRFQPEQQAYLRPSLKLTPAFGYRTFVAQYEHPLSDHLSLSLLAGFKAAGNKDDNNLNPRKNNSLKSGYLVDVVGKYYFNLAPSGFYALASAGASNIIYDNGTVRPYSFTPGIKKLDPTKTDATIPNPKALRVAIGAGYQWTIIPRTLIADFNFNIGSYSNSDGSYVQMYFTPSVGYIF